MRCICQMRVRSLKGAYLYMRIGILYDSNRLLFTNVIGGDYNVTKALSPSRSEDILCGPSGLHNTNVFSMAVWNFKVMDYNSDT